MEFSVFPYLLLVSFKGAHQMVEAFVSSSSSESLWMVMMLTAGLGVSEMMMG